MDDLTAGVGAIAVACLVLDGASSAREANAVFESDPSLTSVAVRTDAGYGLLTRIRLKNALTGSLGYGWALHQHRPIADLLPVGQHLLAESTSAAAASDAANARPPEHRYDDLLVVDDAGSVRVLPISVLLAHLAQHFAHAATYDPLTGLLNRASLHDGLVRAVEAHDTVGVAYLDLDGFKPVNDRLGHEAGDTLLQAVAGRLSDVVASDGMVGRIGGDEFLVVAPGHDTSVLVAWMDQALSLIARPVQAVDGAAVTASAGVAFAGGQVPAAPAATAAVRSAYRAMYVAKSRGGNQVVLAMSLHGDRVA